MSPDDTIMFVESALRPDAQRRIRAIGHADLLVGIPAYKNARTIGHVVQVAALGMTQYYPSLRHVVVVADGMSTDETVQVATESPIPTSVAKIVTTYQGLGGKGSAIRAIFEIAKALGVRACVLLDADLRSVTPEWIYHLAQPVLHENTDYVTPIYSRHWNEVTINDSLAYPLTRMLYGVDIRQPLGGEVALSRDFLTRLLDHDVWETDVARFGINIWMTILAIVEGWHLAQVQLGTKTHDFRDPTIGFEPKFLQVMGTLFRTLSIYRRLWPAVTEIKPVVTTSGIATLPEPEPVASMRESLREAVRKGIKRFRKAWSAFMTPENAEAINNIIGQDQPLIPFDLWARVVMDFAVIYNKGEGDPDKVVMALLPLYYAHKLSWITMTDDLRYDQVEELVQKQTAAFEAQRPYLIKRWTNNMQWEEDELL
jgi:glucosylglycerate synthase